MTLNLQASQHAKIFSNWLAVCTCAAIPISLAITNVFMAMLLVSLIVSHGAVDVRQSWRDKPIAWLVIALFLWILCGAAYTTAQRHEYVLHISKYSKLLVTALLFATLTTEQWKQRCLTAFMMSLSFILASQYAEIFWDLPWTVTKNQGWGIDHVVVGDYITQGVMVTFMLAITLTRALNGDFRDQKTWLWAMAALLCLLSVTGLSSGRTGYVLALMTVAIIFALRWSGVRLAISLAVLALAFTGVYVSSKGVQNRLSQAHQEIFSTLEGDKKFSSLGGRLENYRQSVKLLRERPLVGWGTGSFHEQSCRVASTPEMCKQASWHPHNQYFLFAVQGGIVALGLFVAILLLAALNLSQASMEAKMIGLSFVVIFAVDSLVNSSLFSARESHFFSIFLVVVLAGQLQTKNKV
jgi:O-antigen ligase